MAVPPNQIAAQDALPPGVFLLTTRPVDGRTRPVPTPELQELFNIMRDVEKGLTFDDRIQLQDGPAVEGTDGNAFLRPRSPSHATSMSRSPSYTSSHSITRAIRDVGIHDAAQQETGGRKPKRHGPLDRYTKARAAFVRKLGACSECRGRKVKCSHHDLSLFEDAYQAAKRNPTTPAVGIQNNGRPNTSPDPPIIGIGGSGGQTLRTDLLGMDENPASRPVDHAGLSDEIEQILPQLGPVASPTRSSSLQHPGRLLANSPWSLSPMPNSYFAPRGPIYTDSFSPKNQKYIPIGREVAGNGPWECQGGSEGTQSSWYSVSGDVCLRRFDSLPELSTHFLYTHLQFREDGLPFMFKCLRCQFLNDQWSATCPHCSWTPGAWERWYYGFVVGDSSTSSGDLISIPAQEPGVVCEAPLWSSNGQAQGNQPASSAAYTLGGYGSGGYQHCRTRPTWGQSWELFITRHLRFVFMFFLASVVFLLGYDTPNCGFRGTDKFMSKASDRVCQHVPESSVLFIVAGIVAMLLFHHVRFRFYQRPISAPADEKSCVDLEPSDSGLDSGRAVTESYAPVRMLSAS